MESLYQIISLYIMEITFVALILSLVTVIITLINFYRTSKIIKKYRRMMRGMDNKNLEYMLQTHLETIEKANNKMNDLEHNMQLFAKQLGNCVKKAALVRYNPFDQMGGDQSFSMALLDEHGDGVVLTGLYSREASATYAKPIIAAESKYSLSNEEKQAIELALNKSDV